MVTILRQSSHKTNFFFPPCFLFPLLSPWGHDVFSCIVHFSTRHTVAHRLVNTAVLVPQGAYRFLLRLFHRHRVMARMAWAYGTWTSCRFARWEAGHQTGRTFESLAVIFDQARDVPDEGQGSSTNILLPTAGRYIVRSRIC